VNNSSKRIPQLRRKAVKNVTRLALPEKMPQALAVSSVKMGYHQKRQKGVPNVAVAIAQIVYRWMLLSLAQLLTAKLMDQDQDQRQQRFQHLYE
jgi:hypothetical protein